MPRSDFLISETVAHFFVSWLRDYLYISLEGVGGARPNIHQSHGYDVVGRIVAWSLLAACYLGRATFI